MSILIVGNVIKDVYLNLDSRTEKFEADKHNTKWLNLAFNASEHHFFSRVTSLGGAAVSLEVLTKLGIEATIAGSNLKLTDDGLVADPSQPSQPTETHRYIMLTDGQPCYLVPSEYSSTSFTTPTNSYDYLYVDRSAELTEDAARQITAYLDVSSNTQLVLYVRNLNNPHLASLLPRANLVFLEGSQDGTTADLDQAKLIRVSEDSISYQNINEQITAHRIDTLTHLSAYSIASATILGSFILGKSVEDSLKLARLNLENAKLNASLSLAELQELATEQSPHASLELIAKNLVMHPKGILAADESGGSIHKKFDQLKIPDTYDNRRNYRNIFFTTNGLENYVNGVILFDETARQSADNGQNFVDFLTAKRIIPGIKVDQGLEKFSDSTPPNYDSEGVNPDETWTKGLDDLDARLREYYQMGLRFAKWRAAFEVRLDANGNLPTPTDKAIDINCQILADYAKICQDNNIVPIVEPELVYDGYYTLDQSAEITAKILDRLFAKLQAVGVNLGACILKVNMVLAGKKYEQQSTPDEVGIKTAEVLKNHIPAELAGVVFLSGGQTVEQATHNLAKITRNGPYPWPVTFSFARALQDPALYAWAGDNKNSEKARTAFFERLVANQNALKNNPD